MKVIRRISGAVCALSAFWAWGTVGLADMGELHVGRLVGLVAVCVLSGAAWLMAKEVEE